jgi:hypothetical protein
MVGDAAGKREQETPMGTEPEPTEPQSEDLSVISDVFAVTDEDTVAAVEARADENPVMRYTQGGSPC